MESNELITNALRYINGEYKNSELTIENMQFGEPIKDRGNFSAADIGYEIVNYSHIIEF